MKRNLKRRNHKKRNRRNPPPGCGFCRSSAHLIREAIDLLQKFLKETQGQAS